MNRIYTTIEFNWYHDREHGPTCDTYRVGSRGVKSISDVSEHGTCFRVEFNDGHAELIFNPNHVSETDQG